MNRVPAAGCELRLILSLAAWYELRLTLSHGWLEFRWLDTSYSWLHRRADSSSSTAGYDVRLIPSCSWLKSASWTRLAADLYFNASSTFKDLFCKIQGIIQKKSASGSRTLLFVIFDKKCPFFQKTCYFKAFLSKTMPNVPFFKDFRRCVCMYVCMYVCR